MIGYSLALLVATAQAVHIHSHSHMRTHKVSDSPCYNTGAIWDAQVDGGETEPFYDISNREENLLWRGAWDGYYEQSDLYWDLLNGDNDCEWPELVVECTSETGHDIPDNVFELSRWGLLSIYPDMIPNLGLPLLEARCEMWTFFEDFPIDGPNDEGDDAPPGATYLTKGTFTMAIGYNV